VQNREHLQKRSVAATALLALSSGNVAPSGVGCQTDLLLTAKILKETGVQTDLTGDTLSTLFDSNAKFASLVPMQEGEQNAIRMEI